MKNVAFVLMSFLVVSMTAYSQWVLQTNPLGTGSEAMLGKIQFVSATEGWIACGHNCSLLHTTDAGATWNIVTPFSGDVGGNMSDPGKSMSWVNPTHGWAFKTSYPLSDNDDSFVTNADGAFIYRTTDGGSTWTKKEFPKAISTVSYSVSDLTGTWKLHGIVAKNNSNLSSLSGWIRADCVFDANGNLSVNGVKSDGTELSMTASSSLTTRGKLRIDGDEMGFMSSDKNLLILTGEESNNSPALYILQKVNAAVSYTNSDLQGSWQMQCLSVENAFATNPSLNHASLSIDASGNLTGTYYNMDNSTESINSQISIDANGNIASGTKTSLNGFMSSDKKTFYITLTENESQLKLLAFEKQVDGISYSGADLQGCWQMHSIVPGVNSTLENSSVWTSGTLYMNSDGSFSVANMLVNGEEQDVSGTSLTLASNGIVSGFGETGDGYGFLSSDKSLAILINTEENGGVNFGIIQKDLSVSGDLGLQTQFVDQNNGWASVYNYLYNYMKIYRTADGGENWTQINSETNAVGGFYHFLDASNGWMIGTPTDSNLGESNLNNILHTTDGGLSWTQQASNIGQANDIYFSDLLHGWVVGDNALVLKTVNGGATWSPVTNAGVSEDADLKTVFFLNASTGWFGSETSNETEGVGSRFVVRTDDGGTNWTTQHTPVTNSIFSLSFWDENNGWLTSDYGQIAHYTAPKTVNVSAGGLSSALTSNEKATLSGLTITGTIDARDFKIMRDDMPLLAEIDMSNVSIAAYSGLGGTYSSDVYTYPANTLPRSGLYNKASLVSIILPVNLTAIGRSALNACTGLSTVVIPSTVITIDTMALRSSALTHIVIPASVATIDYAAFYDCAKLKSVEFEGTPTVSTIGVFAFGYCKELTQIDIPSSTTFIGDVAFLSTRASVNVNANNPNYSSEEGILFDKDKTVLMYCPQTFFGFYTVPSTVKTIGVDAFCNCSELQAIYLPASLETIKEQAFLYCSGLYSLTIPDGVSTIQSEAFYGCSNLQSMYIPESVTTLGYGAFGGNRSMSNIDVSPNNAYFASVEGVLFDKSETKLLAYPGAKGSSYSIPDGVTCIEPYAFLSSYNVEIVTIPSSVSQIGHNAFDDCYNLSKIYVESATPVDLSSSADVFLNVDQSSCVLSVPIGSKTAYQAANQWSDFQKIVETGGTVTYNVTVPEGTKVCYIAGEMNDWTMQAMTKVDDTHYTLTIQDADITQQYKYCSGPSWDFQEMDAYGNFIYNRSYSQSDVVANWKAVFDPSTLTAADYYLPLRVDNYTRLRTNNDYTQGWARRTTTYSFKRIDQINGESYILEEGWEDEFDGCNDCMEGPFRYIWIKKDNEGNIVLGAYAVEEEDDGELSDNLASAYILGEPMMWFPNTFLTVGATLKYAISDTVMNIDSVMSVTATAGSYSNCILVRNIERTTSGVVTFMEDHYYAYQLGLVMQNRLIPADEAHTDYITGYLADSPTSIKNSQNSGSSVSVYPNPTTDGFYVNAGCTRVDVSVCTVSGTILFTKQVDGTAQQKVSISGLPKGIYLLKLQTPDGTVVKKLVKE